MPGKNKTMPLFKKSTSDSGTLSETQRKVLRRCRMMLIKDLDINDVLDTLFHEDGIKTDVKEQILSYPSREERVGVFLDKLEMRGERSFHLFMETLRDNYRHLHYVLEETIKNIDDLDEARHRDRIAVTGETLRKLLKSNFRRRTEYQETESGDDLDYVFEEKDSCNYIECYTIPMRGYQHESWIKHASTSQEEEERIQDSSCTAVLLKDLIFRKISHVDIPENVKMPPKHCSVYIVDPNQEFSSGKDDGESEADGENGRDVKEDKPPSCKAPNPPGSHREECKESRRKTSDPPPPPVPPKPEGLPSLGNRPLSLSFRSRSRQSESRDQKEQSPKLPGSPKQEKPKPAPKPKPRDLKKDVQTSKAETEEKQPALPTFNVTPPIPPKSHASKEKGDSNQNEESVVTEQTTDASQRPLSMVTEESNSVEKLASSPPKTDSVGESSEPSLSKTHLIEDADEIESKNEKKTNMIAPTATFEEFGDNSEDYESISPKTTKSPENKSEDTKRPDSGFSDTKTSTDTTDDTDPTQDESTESPAGTAKDSVSNLSTESQTATSKDSSIKPDAKATATDSALTETPDSSAESLSKPTTPPEQKKERREIPRRRSSAPLLLPKPLSSDVQVLPTDDSSDDNSYYEDIEIVDGSSPTGKSACGSYLDPKTYARAIEHALLSDQVTDILQMSAKHSLANLQALALAGRTLLTKGSLLVTDMECACMDSKTQDGTEDQVTSDTLEPYKDTTLVFDKSGRAFYIPVCSVKKHGDPEGEPWFYPIEISSRQATLFLSEEGQEGCFLVYRPIDKSRKPVFNLSVCRGNGDVVHYHILQNIHGDVMVENHDRSFMNISELVTYFQNNQSGLVSRLRRPLKDAKLPVTPGYHYGLKWEKNRSDLALTGQIIGRGYFGVVCAGIFQKVQVAVKVLQKSDVTIEDEDDFVNEAKVMMPLQHDHVVRLVGLCCLAKPYFLIMEYVSRGNLKDCLKNSTIPQDNIDTLFDVCIQVTSAMNYLESRHYLLHRDVACRNFLVADDMCIKLADFGRARFVTDDCYHAPTSEKISIKWAAPEVLLESRYSSRADVWSLGVVLWEIFSGGENPYPTLSGEQAAVYVLEGGRLEKSPRCSPDIYAMMKSCWREQPNERPSFALLYDKLKSKSSIYYGPLRTQASVSDSYSVKIPSPPANKAKQSSATMPRTPVKNRGTMVYDKSEEVLTRDMLDYGKEEYQVNTRASMEKLNLNTSSASETSLVSAAASSTMKEDLTRSDKIRKSLRKIINVKSKRKSSKAVNGQRDDKRSIGPVYGN